MAHDVFISHSSKDKTVADATCAYLESHGIRCWVAPRDIRPGSTWGASIINAIRGSRVMILIFSSHANASPQIHREVERAVNFGVAIIPMRIEDVAPQGDMEYFLGVPHWLDAFGSPMETHLEALASAVTEILAIPVSASEEVPTEAYQEEEPLLDARDDATGLETSFAPPSPVSSFEQPQLRGLQSAASDWAWRILTGGIVCMCLLDFFLLAMIVPLFQAYFTDSYPGKPLPGITLLMIRISNFLVSDWFLLLPIFAVAVGVIVWKRIQGAMWAALSSLLFLAALVAGGITVASVSGKLATPQDRGSTPEVPKAAVDIMPIYASPRAPAQPVGTPTAQPGMATDPIKTTIISDGKETSATRGYEQKLKDVQAAKLDYDCRKSLFDSVNSLPDSRFVEAVEKMGQQLTEIDSLRSDCLNLENELSRLNSVGPDEMKFKGLQSELDQKTKRLAELVAVVRQTMKDDISASKARMDSLQQQADVLKVKSADGD